MSTIKQIIQEFCYRINQPAPTSIVGSSAPMERQYLSIFKKIGDDLRNRPFDWPQLKRTYTFTTAIDVRRYHLPGDFYRILESTQWDITNRWPLRGAISDFAFTYREFAVVSLQTRKAYRLIGPTQYLYSTSPYTKRSKGVFEIDPAGSTDTDQLIMGYVSGNWIWPKDWVANTSYAAGSIVSGDGYTYITEAGGTSGSTRPNWDTGTDSDGSVDWTVWTEDYSCDSANTHLSDDDLCQFDDDIMIEGMIWAYKKLTNDDYQQLRLDWEESIKGAYARFDGPKRINMADTLSDGGEDWPLTPPGNWDV